MKVAVEYHMLRFHLISKASRNFPSSPALFLTLSTLLLFVADTGWASSVNSTIREGIADYQKKDYEQAESKFSKAESELPGSPMLNYNLANSQYKTGKYHQALQNYTKAMAADTPPELKEKSLYNTGNALFRMGNLEEAESAYKKALEMDSQDMDAKFNLEFVREQLKKKNQEKQNQGSNPDDKGNQDQNSPQDNNNQGEKENSSNQEDQKSSSAGEAEQNGEPLPAEYQETQTSSHSQTLDNSISKDQADHWLSALNEDLKKFRQKQARKENPGSPNQTRDW